MRLEESPLVHRPLAQQDAERLYSQYPLLARNHHKGCPACGKNRGWGDGVVVLDGEEWECNCHDQLQRQKHYLDAGVGQTYQFLTWKDFTGDQDALSSVRSYVDDLTSNIESGRGLMLRGRDYGTGKTFMATLIARAAVLAGFSTYMVTLPDLLSSMKAGWHDAEYDRWRRNKVESAMVLVLDDVGKELMEGQGFNNDYASRTFDNLVRTRVQQGRPTIVTTNLTRNEMHGSYGMALKSLLDEMGDVVEFHGNDFRPLTRPPLVGQRRIW